MEPIGKMPRIKNIFPLVHNVPHLRKHGGLTSDQKLSIERSTGLKLSIATWKQVEAAIEIFTARRWLEIHSVSQKLLQTRLDAISEHSKKLLNAIVGQPSNVRLKSSGLYCDPLAMDLWEQVHGSGATNQDISQFSNSLFHLFRNACLEARDVSRIPPGVIAWGAWKPLVRSLVGVFDQIGEPTTASSSSNARMPRQSKFVRFVWELMQVIPKPSRLHSHSESGMAKAIQRELRVIRSNPRDNVKSRGSTNVPTRRVRKR